MTAPGTCKDCPALIAWAKTTRGRMMPLDAERDPVTRKIAPIEVADGNIEPTGATAWGRDGQRVPVVKNVGPGQVALPGVRVLWRSHFATCPKADANRRPRQRATARRWDR